MSNDDLTRTSTATTTDNLIPVNLDREPIIFSDNDASIEGILYEVGRFYKRTGQFQMLFKHRAVSLSNGKLAVESLNSVYWTTGSIASSAGFDAPCLPTATRYNDYVSRATAAGAKIPKDLTGGAAPAVAKTAVAIHAAADEQHPHQEPEPPPFNHHRSPDDHASGRNQDPPTDR